MGHGNLQSSIIEGFCWNNILNPEARLLKVKIKGASVNDVGSMSLIPFNDAPLSYYFVAILNSNLLFDFYREFINCSVNIQINDIRQMPIVIPTPEQLNIIKDIANQAISYRHHIINENDITLYEQRLRQIEFQLDEVVESIYMIKFEN